MPGGSTGGGASSPAGRFPPNVCLSHTLWCEPVGTRRVRGGGSAPADRKQSQGAAYQFRAGVSTWNPNGHNAPNAYTDPDGYETVEAWACAEDCPVWLLDAQSGERRVGGRGKLIPAHPGYDGGWAQRMPLTYADAGGASRFFYVSKASTAERNRGLPDGQRNGHPTVKPLALCRWLVRLITPPGGTVLDPFMGSGSIGCAALAEGLEYVGVEREREHCDTAAQRIGAALPLDVGA
jgi:hypothetical protein